MDAGVSWPNEASMTCKMDENITNIMALFDATSSGNLSDACFHQWSYWCDQRISIAWP